MQGYLWRYIPIINKKQYKIPNSPAKASHHGSLVPAHHVDEPNIKIINAMTPHELAQLNQMEQHSKSHNEIILKQDVGDLLF